MASVFISAAHKSSGKTLVSVGLTAALTQRGVAVQPFKKGPDYIDPLWLAAASGRACYNLDFNTQERGEIIATAARAAGRFALIEGNKGLHDGMDVDGRDSNAALAKVLEAPVVLVIDTSGITRGIAPLVLGYRDFDRQVRIAGVILNRVAGPRQEGKLRQAVERYCDMPVIGAIGRDSSLSLTERHLGLITPGEAGEADCRIARIRDAVAAGVDLERIIAIAESAPALAGRMQHPSPRDSRKAVTIAVARDAAFCFYYADDLEALERAGAQLVFFSPLNASHLPEADALFLGGGFPETHAQGLAANKNLRREIRDAASAGMPVYAECGGLMYLSRSIEWNGESHEMAGVIPADAVMSDRPQGRGLVALEATGRIPWLPASMPYIQAHEFHYARLENVDASAEFAFKVNRGAGIGGGRDGIVIGNTVAGFTHLRDTSRCRWAESFVSFVQGQSDSAGRAGMAAQAAVAQMPARRMR
jgi:cobyrinic acid a,c-diamide synthase